MGGDPSAEPRTHPEGSGPRSARRAFRGANAPARRRWTRAGFEPRESSQFQSTVVAPPRHVAGLEPSRMEWARKPPGRMQALSASEGQGLCQRQVVANWGVGLRAEGARVSIETLGCKQSFRSGRGRPLFGDDEQARPVRPHPSHGRGPRAKFLFRSPLARVNSQACRSHPGPPRALPLPDLVAPRRDPPCPSRSRCSVAA